MPIPHSSTARAAVRDIRNIASMFKGLIALADTLRDVDDVQAYQKQEEKRLVSLKAESENLSQQISAQGSELAAKIAAGEQTIRRLSDDAEAMEATLRARGDEAKQIEIDAKQKAANIVAAAKDQARQAVAAEIEQIKARL